jgi:serine/threonine protein kinase
VGARQSAMRIECSGEMAPVSFPQGANKSRPTWTYLKIGSLLIWGHHLKSSQAILDLIFWGTNIHLHPFTSFIYQLLQWCSPGASMAFDHFWPSMWRTRWYRAPELFLGSRGDQSVRGAQGLHFWGGRFHQNVGWMIKAMGCLSNNHGGVNELGKQVDG